MSTRLAVEPSPNDDCSTSVERMTAQELVLSCIGEKWATYENRKFVYDIRSKTLVRYFAYPPYWTAQVLRGRGGPRFVMAHNQQLLLVDVDPGTRACMWRLPRKQGACFRKSPWRNRVLETEPSDIPVHLPHSVAASDPATLPVVQAEEPIWLGLYGYRRDFGPKAKILTAGPIGPEHMAAGSSRRCQKLRPPRPGGDEREIGPHQLEGSRLWFGKTFYNSEGSTGVGGFGYFDAATATYHLYSPPEIQRWSVSAILVEAHCIWLALYRRGEYGNNSGGLLRWDRETAQVRKLCAIPDVVTHIATSGEVIYLGATNGIITLHGDQFTSYFVEWHSPQPLHNTARAKHQSYCGARTLRAAFTLV